MMLIDKTAPRLLRNSLQNCDKSFCDFVRTHEITRTAKVAPKFLIGIVLVLFFKS